MSQKYPQGETQKRKSEILTPDKSEMPITDRDTAETIHTKDSDDVSALTRFMNIFPPDSPANAENEIAEFPLAYGKYGSGKARESRLDKFMRRLFGVPDADLDEQPRDSAKQS